MAILKKKTRKAIRKTFKKAINKHGPLVAQHLATGIAAGLATYLGAEGEEGRKKIKKAVKSLPGGEKIVEAIDATVPALQSAADKLAGSNGHSDEKTEGRTKKSETA